MTEPVNYVTIQCPVSCDISLLLIMWQFNVLYHVTIHNMLSCDKSLYYYLIKYLQTSMSRTKGHNLYIVNLFISWVDKLKCYRILIHTPKARVSNGWENLLESWYTHPRQGFPMCGKMCLNLDTPTQGQGFQWAGKCDWILIHPPNARVSNGWENVLEFWYTYTRAGFPMEGKMCLNLDTPTLTLTQGFLWLLSLFMLFNFVCGLFGNNERIDVDYLLFDYICIAFLLPWGESGSLYE